MNAVWIALGIMLAIGGILVAIINWWLPPEEISGRPTGRVEEAARDLARRFDKGTWTAAGIGAVLGIVVAMFTGWLVFIVLFPVVAIVGKALFFDNQEKAYTEKLFQMESWTRSLSGLIVTGAGLETALVASLPAAGSDIKTEVSRLVARIQGGWNTVDALYALGKEWDDATGDLIAMNLVLAARQRGQGLSNALDDLSLAVAEEVRIRRKTTADRAAPRRQARIVAGTTIALLIVVPFLGGPMGTYQTPLGQLIYLVLFAVVAALLVWMHRVVAPKPQPRLISSTREAVS